MTRHQLTPEQRKKLQLTPEQRDIFAAFGSVGGKKRARKLTAEQRKEIATKASKAAQVARKRKAKERNGRTES